MADLSNPNTTVFTYEELYKHALDNYHGSIIIIDPKANIIYCNDSSGRMLKVNPDWLNRQTMYAVLDAGLSKYSAGLEALQKKIPIRRYFPNQHGEGMLLYSVPILNEKNEVQIVITYSQDEEFVGNYTAWMNSEKHKMTSGMEYIAKKDYFYSSIVAKSPAMKRILEFSANAAASDSTIALYGESGVGKEVLAAFIHRNSKRHDKIFLPVNCATIPPELVESELFGYERGAFTGALTEGKPGLFEIANNGTIFLDEIGDLPPAIQAKLLRVLENKEIRRVGGKKNHKIDIRIICATNRNLKESVANNTFREDLYYRINVVPIKIPPLRNRIEDIYPLADSFLAEFNRKNGFNRSLSKANIETLERYSWPGNVRELRNVMERFVIMSQSDVIFGDFISEGSDSLPNMPLTQIPDMINTSLKTSMKHFEEAYITAAYRQCDYNVDATAKLLQIHRSGLYKKLQDYGILHKG